jgi:MOSC domain-containing protein YiiM
MNGRIDVRAFSGTEFYESSKRYAMTMSELMGNFARDGVVTHIQLRPERGAEMVPVGSVEARPGGLAGDRYNKPSGNRQVTLIQDEHLIAVASLMSESSIDPALTRRNLVVKGINLLSLKGKKFRIGTAILEYTGECHPCSRMETNLGHGGYNAMRGHGGITARILIPGRISVGDTVSAIDTTGTGVQSTARE